MQTNSIATITHSPWYRRAIVALAGLLIAGSVGVGLMSRSHSGAALAPAVSARAPLAAAQVERQTALKQRQLDQLDAQLTSAAAPAPHPIQAERFTTLKQRQLDQLDRHRR